MSKNIITATEVRNNFFNLLELVATTGNPIYIKKDREVRVKLEPVNDELDKKGRLKILVDETRGIWADRTEEEIRGRFREANEASTRKIRARKW